jgi:serine/threonine protein kinase
MENGDLLEWVLSRRPFGEKEGRYLSLQLISRFRYLEQKNIFHRDVKPENILIGNDYKPILIDFGLAVDSRNESKGFVGSSRCAAP